MEAIGHHRNCPEQKYTKCTATETREVMCIACKVEKQEYTRWTATKTQVIMWSNFFRMMKYFSYCSEQEYTEYTTNGNLVVVCLCQMTQLGIPASIQNRGTQIPRQLRPKLYYACVIWSNGIFQHLLWAGVHSVHSNWESSCTMPVSFEAIGHSSICSEQEYTVYTATENLVVLRVIWSNRVFQHLFWERVHRIHSNWEPSFLHLLWSRSTQGRQQLKT